MDPEAHLAAFREWYQGMGVKLNPCLDILWDDTEERFQIRATREIGSEEAMLEVSRDAMITEDVVRNSALIQERIASNSDWKIEETYTLEQQVLAKYVAPMTPSQLLDKILQARQGESSNNPTDTEGVVLEHSSFSNTISKRALFCMFILEPPPEFQPFCQMFPRRLRHHPNQWTRDDLLFLTKSPTGLNAVQQIAATVLLCVQEYDIIYVRKKATTTGENQTEQNNNDQLITFEQYLWACSIYQSCCVNETTNTGSSSDKKSNGTSSNNFNTNAPPLFVPLMDMMKPSVRGGHTVTWTPELARMVAVRNIPSGHYPLHNDGPKDNLRCLTQYGITIWKNSNDSVKIGWALQDAVGGIPSANGTKTIGECPRDDESLKLAWWTSDRLALLQNRLSTDMTKNRIIVFAKADKTYHEDLLTTAVVSTMDPSTVVTMRGNVSSSTGKKQTLYVTRRHQAALREYLTNFFTGKMEKLLQVLDKHWVDHFPGVRLWTKVSEGGGLDYNSTDNNGIQGWHQFFDSQTTMQDSQFAVGPKNAILTLIDGSLRALQQSLTGLLSDDKFENRVLRQLKKLEFKILKDDDIPEGVGGGSGEKGMFGDEEEEGEDNENGGGVRGDGTEDVHNGKSSGKSGGSSRSSKNSRKRNRKRSSGGGGGGNSDRAMKLHIGNLAYSTQASDLFEYFASMYDRENVLECHIPTERDTGRSRGYGFVTMPEYVSQNALSKKHEVHGRLLKVAESNSAGAANRNRGPSINAVAESDRCARCGYSPRYCVCPVPDIPAFNGHPGRGAPPPYHDHMRPPPLPPPPPDMGPYGRDGREFDYYGSNHRRDMRGSFSVSPGRHRGSRAFRDSRDYDRDYHYRRSRSRSYSRGRDRSRERSRDRDRHRYRDRDRSLSRERSRERSSRRGSRYHSSSSRRRRSRSRSVSTDRGSSGSRRRDRERRTERDESVGADRAAGSSSSRNKAAAEGETQKRSGKREGSTRRRSRSRSRSRRDKRKRSSKKDGKKHERRSRSRSRSRSEAD